MSGRSGQTQVLTAVLLGGILVVGVSGSYMWGLPILRKSQDVRNAENSLDGLRQLADGIAEVSQSGGSRSVSVPLGDGSLQINPENDTITYNALTQGAYVATDQWVPLNENDMQGANRSTGEPGPGYGIRGVDEPILIVGRAEPGSDQYDTTYRLISRDMKDSTSGQTYRIDLVEDGNLQATNGRHDIVFSRETVTTVPGAGVDGGILNRVRIRMRIR